MERLDTAQLKSKTIHWKERKGKTQGESNGRGSLEFRCSVVNDTEQAQSEPGLLSGVRRRRRERGAGSEAGLVLFGIGEPVVCRCYRL